MDLRPVPATEATGRQIEKNNVFQTDGHRKRGQKQKGHLLCTVSQIELHFIFFYSEMNCEVSFCVSHLLLLKVYPPT